MKNQTQYPKFEELAALTKEGWREISSKLSPGCLKAFHVWEKTHGKEADFYKYEVAADEVVSNEFTWEYENADFIATLRDNGIKYLLIVAASSALLENLHAYCDLGCELAGLCVVKCHSDWKKDEQGIRLAIN